MIDDTKAFEAEAAVTRDRIAGTIDELQARLSPKALVDNALESLNTAGTRAVASVRTAAGSHPLVLGAAGLAVGMGLLARNRVARAKVEYGDSYAAYADFDDGYADSLADGAPAIGAAREKIDALQHQAHATVDDNPLVVLGVGLAAGAVLGAVVPVSAVETKLATEFRVRLAAAGDAAIAAAKREFDFSRLSLAGGTSGISERLTVALIVVLTEAATALGRPVRDRSAG